MMMSPLQERSREGIKLETDLSIFTHSRRGRSQKESPFLLPRSTSLFAVRTRDKIIPHLFDRGQRTRNRDLFKIPSVSGFLQMKKPGFRKTLSLSISSLLSHRNRLKAALSLSISSLTAADRPIGLMKAQDERFVLHGRTRGVRTLVNCFLNSTVDRSRYVFFFV